jgi:hypothetical protein
MEKVHKNDTSNNKPLSESFSIYWKILHYDCQMCFALCLHFHM